MIALDKKRAASVICDRMAEGGEVSSEPDGTDGMQMAAEDLISAVHGKDPRAVSRALRAAFEMLEMEPDEAEPEAGLPEQ